MSRRERAYVRRYSMTYARRYLGISRLPSGVPRFINDNVNAMQTAPPADWLAPYLAPLLKLLVL